MTIKDYIKIAEVLKKNFPKTERGSLLQIHYDIMELFKADNPRFDREKFIEAIIN